MEKKIKNTKHYFADLSEILSQKKNFTEKKSNLGNEISMLLQFILCIQKRHLIRQLTERIIFEFKYLIIIIIIII